MYTKKKILNSWDWLCGHIDVFQIGNILRSNDEIEGLRKTDAIEKINELITTNNIFSLGKTQHIGYFDKENKRIWVLSPLKMAMLLHKYDEAEKLIDMGLGYTINGDNVYVAGEYPSDGVLNLFGDSNQYRDVPVTDIHMIFADENMPLDLAVKLLDRYVAITRDIRFGDAIQVNPVNERINPKWIMKLYDNCHEKKLLLNELTLYAFSRYPAFTSDLVEYDELGKVTWSRHIYNYKVRLLLQLDVAKILIASKEGEKLKKGIIWDKCGINNKVQSCNKKYTLEQINWLIKQRKRLIKICEDTPNLYRAICLKGLAEVISLKSNLLDNNADNTPKNEEIYKAIENAIDKYEQMIKPYISNEWTDRELQSCLQYILKEMGSMEGVMLVNSICELRKSKLTFSTNLDIMAVVNGWLEDIKNLMYMENSLIFHQSGLSPIGVPIDETMRKKDSHKVTSMTSDTLSNIRWILKGAWVTSNNCELKNYFYENLCFINSETLYRTLYKSDLLVGEAIGEVIERLIEVNALENVPYLFALKSIK